MTTQQRTAILLFTSWLLASCTSMTPQPPAPPSIALITQLLNQQYQSAGNSLKFSTLDNVIKTSGFYQHDQLYVANLTYDYVFTRSFADVKAQLQAMSSGAKLESAVAQLKLLQLALVAGEFKAGDRFPLEAQHTFRLTENGWQLVTDD